MLGCSIEVVTFQMEDATETSSLRNTCNLRVTLTGLFILFMCFI